jgi:hypothetical protein
MDCANQMPLREARSVASARDGTTFCRVICVVQGFCSAQFSEIGRRQHTKRIQQSSSSGVVALYIFSHTKAPLDIALKSVTQLQ